MSSSCERLIAKARAAVETHAMVKPGARVLAAVSGGADSMCLLDVLMDLGYGVEVAHFDHLTREGASTDDAAFVERWADKLGLTFHAEARPVAEEAKKASRSFEEFARQLRYAFLYRVAEATGCEAIATGHHADDDAETILMRILRGTSPKGLAGIPPLRNDGPCRIIRPLIACTRNEILAYLDERAIEFRDDASNSDPSFLRNRVRHELMPLLVRDYNPKLREALLRLGEIQRGEDACLEAQSRDFLDACRDKEDRLDRSAFAQGPLALQRRALLLFARDLGAECPFDRVDAAVDFVARAPAGKAFDLGHGVMLRNARAVTEVLSELEEPSAHAIPLMVDSQTSALGKRFEVRRRPGVPTGNIAELCTPTRQLFDADALGTSLSVRRRRNGDRFAPLGMKGTKKLKDYFIDLGLTLGERENQCLLIAGDRIAWVVGRAISAHAAVTPSTDHILEIEVRDDT